MAKEKKNVYTGTGHRKTSVARVTLTPGTGKITINKRRYWYLPRRLVDSKRVSIKLQIKTI